MVRCQPVPTRLFQRPVLLVAHLDDASRSRVPRPTLGELPYRHADADREGQLRLRPLLVEHRPLSAADRCQMSIRRARSARGAYRSASVQVVVGEAAAGSGRAPQCSPAPAQRAQKSSSSRTRRILLDRVGASAVSVNEADRFTKPYLVPPGQQITMASVKPCPHDRPQLRIVAARRLPLRVARYDAQASPPRLCPRLRSRRSIRYVDVLALPDRTAAIRPVRSAGTTQIAADRRSPDRPHAGSGASQLVRVRVALARRLGSRRCLNSTATAAFAFSGIVLAVRVRAHRRREPAVHAGRCTLTVARSHRRSSPRRRRSS